MDREPPEPNATVHVLKEGALHGPFTIDDLLDLVESGDIDYEDECLPGGSETYLTVREILDWEDGAAPFEEEEGATEVEAEEEAPEPARKAPRPAASPKPKRRARSRSGPPRNPRLILYAGHPSVLSFPFTLSLIAAALGAGYVLSARSGWWMFAGLIAALFGVSWILFQRSLRLYLITPKRIEVVKGFIAKSSNEVRVEDVRAINVHTPGLIGLLGVGTVEFASAGGNAIDVEFRHVYAAHRIKGLVRRLQDARDEEK